MKTKTQLHPLSIGAAKFIKTLGTPATFNYFLIEALEWSHNYQLSLNVKSESDDPHYFLMRLMEYPLTRWMERKDHITSEELGLSFAEISIAFVYNDIVAELANVLIMCARNIKEKSVQDDVALHDHLMVVQALFAMAEHIKEYQEQKTK